MVTSACRADAITIPKGFESLPGVTDPAAGARQNHLSAGNGIIRIAEIWNKNNWLPVVDAFRTFVACPPSAIREASSRFIRSEVIERVSVPLVRGPFPQRDMHDDSDTDKSKLLRDTGLSQYRVGGVP